MILPEEELERIKKILQRAVDKAAGKLDLSDLLTEDNPDGCELLKIFSFYTFQITLQLELTDYLRHHIH